MALKEGVICGPPLTCIAGDTITAGATYGVLVTFNTSSKVVACGAAGTPIGVVYETYTVNQTVPVYPLHGRHLLGTTATITAADFIKAGAAGAVAPAASVTTRHADNIGQAETTGTGASAAFYAWLGV